MHHVKKFFYVSVGLLILALSYHFGATSVGAQGATAPDVAVLAGTIGDGGTIPLPHFADGTEALESECRWIVSTHTSSGNTPNYGGFVCYTTGRVVTVATSGSGTTVNVANYLIIATRATGPVSVQRHTIGELKQLYRSASSGK